MDMEGGGCGVTEGAIPAICLDRLRITWQNLNDDSQSLNWELNTGFLKYEAGVLTTWLQHSVRWCSSVKLKGNVKSTWRLTILLGRDLNKVSNVKIMLKSTTQEYIHKLIVTT